ncbi:MAG: succinate dehydrogenase [Candidatus Eisenbacteria bacterium]|nr:succinate dehydrogenase [Candidatus Eisenbacteria bacterium]
MSTRVIDPHFTMRKIHSLFGLIPIGAFLIFHLWENSLAVRGAAYYTEHVVEKISGMRFVTLLEILFIAVPILFHGVYGVVMWFQKRSNLSNYGYFRNWMYVLQRITAFIAFAFIITHVWETRFQVLTGALAKEELYNKMAMLFSNPFYVAWYAVGITATVFHFVNGLWLMGITWGFTIGPRAQKISTMIFAVVGVLLLALGAQALFGFEMTAQ